MIHNLLLDFLEFLKLLILRLIMQLVILSGICNLICELHCIKFRFLLLLKFLHC